MAAKLECEICGGKLIGKPGGIFECDSCGMEYSTEWAKAKIQEIKGTVKVEGTVEVTGKVQVDGGTVQVEGAVTKESLLKRAEMCCAEKEWKKAKALIEQALSIDPECGEAYLLEVMAEEELESQEKLHERCIHATLPLPDRKSMERAQRFLPELFAQWREEKNCNYEAYRTKYETDTTRLRTLYAQADGLLQSNSCGVFGLRTDGTVLAAGLSPEGAAMIQQWSEITAIACGDNHVVGLRADGTVVAWGSDCGRLYGQCNVETWRDITAITCGAESTFGLRADGTVVAAGKNDSGECSVETWKDIIAVASDVCHTVGLRRDGTVTAAGYNKEGQCNVAEWEDISAIAVSGTHTVGLRKDGTLVAAGKNDSGECNVADCENIAAIVITYDTTVALRKDGTVVYKGTSYFPKFAEQWADMIALACDDLKIIGLRKDGTVTSTDEKTKEKVAAWHDIISIRYEKSCDYNIYGLRRDGTVVTTNTYKGYESISDWRLFNSIDTLEQERAEGLARAKAAHIAKEKAEAERRAQKRAALLAEQDGLQAERSQLKGLFSGKRRKEIEARLGEILTELQELEEQA